jgi:hypothetical protein
MSGRPNAAKAALHAATNRPPGKTKALATKAARPSKGGKHLPGQHPQTGAKGVRSSPKTRKAKKRKPPLRANVGKAKRARRSRPGGKPS